MLGVGDKKAGRRDGTETQAWLASTGAWLLSLAGASSSLPVSFLCEEPNETR